MNVTTISNFRENTKKYFDQVVDDQEVLLITRSDGRTVVAMPLEEYNALNETEYLTRSQANAQHIEKGRKEVRAGKTKQVTLRQLASYE